MPEESTADLKAKLRGLRAEAAKVERELSRRSVGATTPGRPGLPRIGGSFAPPLGPARLADYRRLAADAPLPVRDAMLALCEMVKLFDETPSSPLPGTPHPSGVGVAVPLTPQEVERIWDAVPWDGQTLPDGTRAPRECDMMAELFDALDPAAQRDCRNAAFHLLWVAKELSQDREPMYADRLNPPKEG